jgi:Flp pilus assembly pilin Flp
VSIRYPTAGSRPAGPDGQGLVEYGLILGLSAVLAVAILALFGDQVADVVQWVGETVDSATRGA